MAGGAAGRRRQGKKEGLDRATGWCHRGDASLACLVRKYTDLYNLCTDFRKQQRATVMTEQGPKDEEMATSDRRSLDEWWPPHPTARLQEGVSLRREDMYGSGCSPVFVDTNVLVYARFPESPLYDAARSRLERAEEDGEPLRVSRLLTFNAADFRRYGDRIEIVGE